MNRKSCNRDSVSRNAENLRTGLLKNGNFTLIELLIVEAIAIRS